MKNNAASKKSALLVKLPENIHAKLKIIAMQKNTSVNKLANKVFTDYVNKNWEAAKKGIEQLE